jgi:hypothetical protein
MKAFFSLSLLAIAALALTGCDTCYTECYQPLYDSHGFRATGMEGDPLVQVYKPEDLHFPPVEQDPDLAGPARLVDTHFPPAPVVVDKE